MAENPQANPPRKLRKIKRVKAQVPQGQPMNFGAPTKVNYQDPSQQSSSFFDNNGNDVIYDNNGDAENIHFITEEEMMPHDSDSLKEILQNKNVLILLMIACLIGAMLGYMSAPKSSTVAGRGLEGVVANKDVPKGRSRCGLVEPNQACVLYIMNPKTQDVSGKEFYTIAAKWTGRERYMIETSNMHYGAQRIKPGAIAQINIPAL